MGCGASSSASAPNADEAVKAAPVEDSKTAGQSAECCEGKPAGEECKGDCKEAHNEPEKNETGGLEDKKPEESPDEKEEASKDAGEEPAAAAAVRFVRARDSEAAAAEEGVKEEAPAAEEKVRHR
ncbi:Brain acid soluble protein, putative [Perkinsus marinus ATCC 50983]|uniref:Brain acid soluble protein, putative n=1 Tax=Perkinsus marinus (strain ATCC 50983 / TXsc) TaxID=423536 RepID=C5KG15_PERM5|nr:Brain acid soluble protein, putative [Perkinsus marinus ATCC 50983]EER16579.1 Brain acid soluble protein, putative [Perkinsus marinus ATCC 50983]|eukprot:XP_002784783.1 Brain acid soluble protein, putative [Perkinsus marinus ATCC 50983]